MLIRVTDIPASGLKINETMDLAALNSRLQEGSATDIRFSSAPEVSLLIHRTPSGAQVSGSVKAKLIQPCSRCIKEIEREIEVETNYTLQQLSPRSNPLTEDQDQDIGLVYFDGEHVELDSTLQESLILGLNIYWHPPLNGDGSCKQCGMAKPDTLLSAEPPANKLSELFKKAGIN